MINYIILTKTENDRVFFMVQQLIESLKKTIYVKSSTFDKFRILLVESAVNSKYKFGDDIIVLNYDNDKFNYNHALNIGINHCETSFNDNDWYCYMNNDIVCDRNWMKFIYSCYCKNPYLQAYSPRCDFTIKEVSIGYVLGRDMCGYCFMHSKKILSIIGKFDETFDMYFQDDDYLMQLKKHNLLQASIKDSIVVHLGQQTTGKENMQKLEDGKQKYIKKHGS